MQGKLVGSIGQGMVILVGVSHVDTEEYARILAKKCLHLRVFEDDQGKMNLSVLDVKGELLVISQFTLYGDCRKGRRPSFTEAGDPQHAQRIYAHFVRCLEDGGVPVETGEFGTKMLVEIYNDGPVTFVIEG